MYKRQVLRIVFRNFLFDTYGKLSRLLLQYLDKFISNRLQNANLVLQHSLVIALILIQQRAEAIGAVLLPPLRPGVNLTHLQRLQSLVGIKDAFPVLVLLEWTSLFMDTTQAEAINQVHLSQLPSAPPKIMSVSGLERGQSLCDLS